MESVLAWGGLLQALGGEGGASTLCITTPRLTPMGSEQQLSSARVSVWKTLREP